MVDGPGHGPHSFKTTAARPEWRGWAAGADRQSRQIRRAAPKGPKRTWRTGAAGCSTPRRDYRAVTPTLARRARRVHQRGGTPRCPLTVRRPHRHPSGIATRMGRDGTARRRASDIEPGPAASQETASLSFLDVPRQCRQDPSEALLPIMQKQDLGGSLPKNREVMP